jgi:hypothetical protein
VFTGERHVRGKWVCGDCKKLIQAPVPAQKIDRGIPTAGLPTHVMIAKFADHLPLYRQESIFGRAGLATVWIGNSRALTFYPRQGYEHLGSPSYTFQNETHENQLFGKILG